MRQMSENPKAISKHIFTAFATMVLTTVVLYAFTYINLVIKFGPNPGPFADMAGLGFCMCSCLYLFLLFFLMVLIGVISELGKRLFQNKINQWQSTLLIFLFITVISILVLSLLVFIVFHNELTLSLLLTPVLDTSAVIGVIGIVYWLILTNLNDIFAKMDAALYE
jgi:membrane protease YdiL (CAAX protease family)